MRNSKEKAKPSRDIAVENQELMMELERIQEKIEGQEKTAENLEKENQKLKMFQNFKSVFSKSQTNKDSVIIEQMVKDLEGIKLLIASEVQEIGKLRKEKAELTKKIEIIDLEMSQHKPAAPVPEVTRKLTRDRSFRDVAIKFS